MSVSIDTADLKALAAELAANAVKVEAIAATNLSEIAQELQADAKSRAPVDTGALRDSIYIRGGKDFRTVGSDIRYARFVEYGTSDTSPQPFMNPAARKAEQSLLDEFRKLRPFD